MLNGIRPSHIQMFPFSAPTEPKGYSPLFELVHPYLPELQTPGMPQASILRLTLLYLPQSMTLNTLYKLRTPTFTISSLKVSKFQTISLWF